MENIIIVITSVCIGLVIMFHQSDFKIVHKHAELVEYNRTYLSYVRLLNVKPNRTYRAYTIYFHLERNLDGDDYKLHVVLEAILNNILKLQIIGFDLQVCRLLKRKEFGVDRLFESSNLTICPIKQGYYGIENFNARDEKLPPNIPPGQYRLALTFFKGTELLTKAYVYVDIVYIVKQ